MPVSGWALDTADRRSDAEEPHAPDHPPQLKAYRAPAPQVENDQELFMIYKKEGTDEWEEIDIGVSEAPKAAEGGA